MPRNPRRNPTTKRMTTTQRPTNYGYQYGHNLYNGNWPNAQSTTGQSNSNWSSGNYEQRPIYSNSFNVILLLPYSIA